MWVTLSTRDANLESHRGGEKITSVLRYSCKTDFPAGGFWTMWLTEIWSESESGSETVWKRDNDNRDGGDIQSECSFVTYHLPRLPPAAKSWGNGGERGTLRIDKNVHLHTLEEDIRILVNGGVWIIMNKGTIMIIINGLGGGGWVNGNAFHSPL